MCSYILLHYLSFKKIIIITTTTIFSVKMIIFILNLFSPTITTTDFELIHNFE